MLMALTVSQFLQQAVNCPILDVRSPGEFVQGHLPGAFSFPLFSDEERAKIGTLYKKEGHNPAVLLGLEMVGPKLAHFVRQAEILAPNRGVLVHCWRGGMRSGSMAWLLQSAGFKVNTLAGGYKAFRHSVLNEVPLPQKLLVLGGYTGSRKTEILSELKKSGASVLDLEGLACHRGSAFGSIENLPQPTNEQFENEVFAVLFRLQNEKQVWVEDESNPIGKVHFQRQLFDRIRESHLAFLDISVESRIQYLVELYGSISAEELTKAFQRIAKRLGGQAVKEAMEALKVNDLKTAAALALQYYDKAYRNGLQNRTQTVLIAHFEEETQPELIVRLKRWAESIL